MGGEYIVSRGKRVGPLSTDTGVQVTCTLLKNHVFRHNNGINISTATVCRKPPWSSALPRLLGSLSSSVHPPERNRLLLGGKRIKESVGAYCVLEIL